MSRGESEMNRSVVGWDMPTQRAIELEELQTYFRLPEKEVAKRLGICLTSLKKVCRSNGIYRWPYRKVRVLPRKCPCPLPCACACAVRGGWRSPRRGLQPPRVVMATTLRTLEAQQHCFQ